MSYALDFADEAVEDLERLLESLPSERRDPAAEAVEAALLRFAASPLDRPRPGSSRPFVNLSFRVAEVNYFWAATYVFSQDETRVVITHIYRIAL